MTALQENLKVNQVLLTLLVHACAQLRCMRSVARALSSANKSPALVVVSESTSVSSLGSF